MIFVVTETNNSEVAGEEISRGEQFRWGDEMSEQNEVVGTEDDGQSFSNVMEMLEAEDAAEMKRLEDFLKLLVELESQTNNVKDGQSD